MRARKLIREFDSKEALPVDVNEVVEFLRKEQIKDEINFVGVDIDVGILRGSINHFVVPGMAYREAQFCADIFYDQRQTKDWQRLVCCKELLHLLDEDDRKVKTTEQIEHQIQRMVLPSEFQEIRQDGARVISDKIAVYFAVAVLFPWSARDLLAQPYKEGKLVAEDIARMADIPERYAHLVMDDGWTGIHAILLGD